MEINRTHELRNRILFTVFMLAVYFLGKGIVLYGVSAGGGTHAGLNPPDSDDDDVQRGPLSDFDYGTGRSSVYQRIASGANCRRVQEF